MTESASLSAIRERADQSIVSLTEREFEKFRAMIHRIAGISMGPAKKPLVSSRLMKRLRHYNLSSFSDYFDLISDKENSGELQVAVDLLTTNETYFFREQKHFDFLSSRLEGLKEPGRKLRVWSAACSSGEEPYTIAMLLNELAGAGNWEVHASDLSTRVLELAGKGIYPQSRTVNIPRPLLEKYCLKGIGSQTGKVMVDPVLRAGVKFFQHNLKETYQDEKGFDIIFLRNVMIYFDQETKRQVVERLMPLLRPGGYFFISHSETLNGVNSVLKLIQPAVYQKPFV